MGGIHREHVEWAVVNRMRAMLETPRDDFSVTETFALFSGIVMWVKNRAWTGAEAYGPNDDAAREVREQLRRALIVDEPWKLSRALPNWDGTGVTPLVNGDFLGMTGERFFKWLRDALAHGDGRIVAPLHRPAPDYESEWLGGFEIKFNQKRGSKQILHLTLTKDDMRNLGVRLAGTYCSTLAGGDDFVQQDVATRILEVGNEAIARLAS